MISFHLNYWYQNNFANMALSTDDGLAVLECLAYSVFDDIQVLQRAHIISTIVLTCFT
jgi:hypothetical protein